MLVENHFQDVNNVVNALRDKIYRIDHDRITTKEQSKMTMAKTVTCLLPFKARFKICVYFGLTKDAEPIKAEINLDNKKMLESWKNRMMI